MNTNIFFILVSSVLIMINISFEPMDVNKEKSTDVALFNVSSFTMYEFDKNGLTSLTSGLEGAKYIDKYAIEFIDYTDNSKDYIVNMKADSGIYENDNVYLNGDVVYFREDGLTFETQQAIYNKKTTIVNADGNYTIYRDNNKIIGKKLKYNNSLNTFQSRDVSVVYQLEKSTR